ncbi:SusD-like starch-binding protein associating with outer membrane [Flavobacterium sp. 90]|uniref:RagB/SusD family nutrient uptake outer membrane protein n=1 Tax=unclassified Flavobacterium TaxID=196869 RepID=UPI000F18938F|nr:MULTISPECIES: RagB/SusD family nutrient uptake outer membrane protein [unclassified Flavobacterium]RKR05815.1 SusD-like starch-binding protein associating with outer membrane [Flavobacterium sp. 81]TCK57126.1 SusD-like starch-binding protein associating with outer membrane [Flavobacterium sp. 90]
MKYFKNRTGFKLALLFTLLCLLQGCSDFLEQEPGTQISITEQLKNKQGMLQAVNGMYRGLEANVRAGVFPVYADVQGGNLKFTPSTTVSSLGLISIPSPITNLYSFEDQSDNSNFASFYSNSYSTINQSNLILEFVDALPDATEAEKNQIKAEALTVRAYSHFLLSEVFSQNYAYTDDASHLGIIYNKASLVQGLTYPARETAANTYALLIDDITTAINLYANASLLTGPAYSYFNKTSAKALLARVYLSKKDWKNAYETSNDIILNSGVSLVNSADYIAQWEQPDLPVSEILLEFTIPKTTDGTSSGSLSVPFGYTSATVYGDYAASQDLLDLYENDDIRKQLFLEKTIPTLVNLQFENQKYYFTKKFQGNPGYVAFRLSEQYLIRAEAALKLNNPEQAKTDINTIRARSNATLLTDTNNLEELIFLERRKELCFEGHLFFDLARNKKDISRNDGCISLNCSLTYPSPKYVMPIPRFNINLNPNLKQNESY